MAKGVRLAMDEIPAFVRVAQRSNQSTRTIVSLSISCDLRTSFWEIATRCHAVEAEIRHPWKGG